jgi:maltose phosphorylase
LKYTQQAIDVVRKDDAVRFKEIIKQTSFNEGAELTKWKDIIEKMYYPEDPKRGLFLQQDGFLDKELLKVTDLKPQDRPIHQKWSWDRILRSCFIKQADVLQGLYFLEDQYTIEQIRENFDFYEPMTVHESSLSPCVHAILAARLGYKQKAYEFYLRTARLDLDDYNNDTEDGCHITSMAGTWLSLTKGFGGMRVADGKLYFNPFLPEQWKSYSFRLEFRGRVIKVRVTKEGTETILESGEPMDILLKDDVVRLENGKGEGVSSQ